MKISDTLSYYFKNFFNILWIVILPALFLGVLLKPFGMIEMLYNLPNLSINNFASLFYVVYSYTWYQWLLLVFGLIILAIFTSMLVSKIENHFRTGKIQSVLNNSLNYNIVSISKSILFAFVISFLINILSLLLIYLIYYVCTINKLSIILCMILSCMLYGFSMFVIMRVVTCFMFAGLDAIIMGSPYNVALANANRMITKQPISIICVEVLPLLVVVLFMIIGCILNLTLLTNVLSIIIIYPYIVILGMINIFTYYDIKRYDNRQYYLR